MCMCTSIDEYHRGSSDGHVSDDDAGGEPVSQSNEGVYPLVSIPRSSLLHLHYHQLQLAGEPCHSDAVI